MIGDLQDGTILCPINGTHIPSCRVTSKEYPSPYLVMDECSNTILDMADYRCGYFRLANGNVGVRRTIWRLHLRVRLSKISRCLGVGGINMQVSDVYAHMRGLGILSMDAITAGAMSLMEVTAQILVLLQIYAQVTMLEVFRLMEHGPQSLDFELWLPFETMGETINIRQRAEAHLNPQFGMIQLTVIRGRFKAHFRVVKATLLHILSYYVNLLQLHPTITQALMKLVDRLYPIYQQFCPNGVTVPNFMWVLRMVERSSIFHGTTSATSYGSTVFVATS